MSRPSAAASPTVIRYADVSEGRTRVHRNFCSALAAAVTMEISGELIDRAPAEAARSTPSKAWPS